MRILRNLIWVLLLIGACALGWWFTYGWRQSSGDNMIERDYIRFGPVPIILGGVWLVLLVMATLLPAPRSQQKTNRDLV